MIHDEKMVSKKKRELLHLLLAEKGVPSCPEQRIRPRGEYGLAPLSYAQERLWFLDQLEPNSVGNHISTVVRLLGKLETGILERSFQEIVRRHEALRTIFPIQDGQPVQQITSAWDLPLPVDDLKVWTDPEQTEKLSQLLGEEAQRPFDLTNGPLVRMRLLQLESQVHVLVVTMHHIVSDGWSMNIFIQEVTRLYESFRKAQLSPLPKLPIQYADFAVWQRQWLTGIVLEKQLTYWRNQLHGAQAVLSLPTGRPRPAIQGYAGASYTFTVSEELLGQLHALGRREGITLYMLLLAAFEMLLSRYSGQENFCVGTPIANRTRLETEPLIGFFVNMIVIRSDMSGDPSVTEIFRRVRECVLGAQAHQDLPFEKLVEVLQPERSLSHSPLFQVMFALHKIPAQVRGDLEELCLRPMETSRNTTTFDMSLEVGEDEKQLVGVLTYSTDLFKETTIRRMAEHYQQLLAWMVVNPSGRLSEMSLLTEFEHDQVVNRWNATARVWEREAQNVVDLFEAQVDRTPEAVAVVCHRQEMTFAELNARANAVAQKLRMLGVGPEVMVGLCFDRSVDMVVGVLGVWKAGGAYVPLDPVYPPARLAFILEDARPAVLLTQQALRYSLPACDAHVLYLDENGISSSEERHENTPHAVGAARDPVHLAYAIYTSGSTGQPKGVMISHQSLVNFLAAMRDQLHVTRDDRVLAVTSLSFDIAVLELFLPLTVGACVVLADTETTHDGLQLRDKIEESGVTMMQATPATWRMLADVGWESQAGLQVLSGGEALSPDLATPLLERGARLWNLYGPTETTVWSTSSLVTEVTGPIPIGHPIANTQVYVLDRCGQPVPIGVLGELYIGGMGLARGYWQRPTLTAERFVPNPFSPQGGERLYRTGDLVRYAEDGTLEFIGRHDHQVKVRGYRIELGEIEAQLQQEKEIEVAVVVAREGPRGSTQLTAYVVPAANGTVDVSAVKEAIAERLPGYMVPTRWVELANLPLTSNGKIDRQRLPDSESTEQVSGAYVGPRTPTEERLAKIWAEVLDLERVSLHDNFFELGGHSLLAVQVCARIQKTFRCPLSVRTFFQTPTVAGLANFITTGLGDSVSPLIVLQSGERRSPLYCLDPSGTHVLAYQPLASSLETEQAVYGIPLTQLFFLSWQEAAIQTIAKEHVRIIQRQQPEGPYHLLGWSTGGLIALSVAQALERNGQSVTFLGILDTQLSIETHLEEHLITVHELLRYLDVDGKQKFEKLPQTERLHFQECLRQKLSVEEQIEFALRWAEKKGILSQNESETSVQVFKFVYALRRDAARLMHECRRCMVQVPIHAWWASETVQEFGDALIDWKLFTTGEVRTETIDGTHKDVVESPIVHQRIAEILNRLHVS